MDKILSDSTPIFAPGVEIDPSSFVDYRFSILGNLQRLQRD